MLILDIIWVKAHQFTTVGQLTVREYKNKPSANECEGLVVGNPVFYRFLTAYNNLVPQMTI
ncbi:hypothetical protein, partial [Zeaxanthinibacter enoshimensis]|uniref:hypothetical protein n=1 Tax=Zeaxanthinibacter enoshimensis TaxID=392009 RepID=UPI00356A2A81